MRYYRVVVRDQDGFVLIPNLGGQAGFTPVPFNASLSTYTSLNDGMSVFDVGGSNPAALRVEIDIPVTFMDASLPNSYITITGIGMAEISQAANLNGMYVQIYAGMAAGLPLANPSQAGLIASGQIIQSFGNRVGPIQTLSIYVGAKLSAPSSSDTTGTPGTVLAPTTQAAPANLVFQWKAGQPLMDAVTNTLQTAYPTYSIVGAVHEGLVWVGATATAMFQTIQQFATYLRQKSLSIISGYAPPTGQGVYPGVSMWQTGTTINIADGTSQTTPKQILFQELIGQPVWSAAYTVQAICPMRGDIKCGDYVTLPPSIPGITEQASNSQYFTVGQPNVGGFSNASDGSIFTGTFQVVGVRHVGDSRDPGYASWVTALDLILAFTQPSTTGLASLPGVYTAPATNKFGFTGSTTT